MLTDLALLPGLVGVTMRNVVFQASLLAAAVLGLALHGDCRAQEREAADRQVRLIVQTGHPREILAVSFSTDGKRILTAGISAMAILWDVETGKELGVHTMSTGVIFAAALSRDGKRFLANDGFSGAAIVRDLQTDKDLLVLKSTKGTKFHVTAAVFSPDETRILTGSGDGMVRLWDAGTGKQLYAFRATNGVLKAVAFSPTRRHGSGTPRPARNCAPSRAIRAPSRRWRSHRAATAS
jgi:WD40 repeat protein